MQRILRVGLIAACCVLASCNRQAPSPRDVAQPEADKPVPVATGPAAATADPSKAIDTILANLAQPNTQEQCDAALLQALGQISEKKYADALASLETARALRDGEQIQEQIEHVKALLAQQAAAEKTVQDIRSVLNDGKAEDAAKLSTTALGQFGGSDAADELAKLKRQADALAVAPVDDRAARRNLFLQEALAAMKDNNLRSAAIGYEQVLQTGDDANIRKDLHDIRAKLTRYDDGRRRAADLRRDPANLEDALAALGEARDAWDTPQVRAEIDECQLWLQRRRDRISVADFEVRGDVGLPLAGRTVAETLLPAFKVRFDLVEREQFCKVLEELKLEASAATDTPQCRQALGRLAKVRYLVVGSLTPLCGITLNARMVDVQTGLIVQTARYSAPSMEALLAKLPLVAQMLAMTDEQKLAFEQQLARQQLPEVLPIVVAPLPPPPVVVVTEPPPPPIITFTLTSPAFGGVVIEDFRRERPPVVEVEYRRDDPRRQRLFQLSVELGDNLFRRGKYKEANRHFELALTLTDDRRDIEVRIGRCKPLLPPPPPPTVIVVTPPPARPRAIVFNFFVNCQPGLVPPAVGDWAADNFASYLAASFDIVERGEVCWYMGRLGITLRDVMNDAFARRSLAQALNVRFVVFSAIEETHSLNVTTQLVDADTGAQTGSGMIHVQDHEEMKLRMQELAGQIAAPKDQQAKLAKQAQDNEKAITEARRLQKSGNAAKAAQVAKQALQQDPNNVALHQLAQENERLAPQAAAEQARRKEAERLQAEMQAAQKRQAELARQAEAARLRAEQDAKTRGEAAKREDEAKRQRACDQLMTQGRDALKRNDYAAAVQSFQSATALKPNDDGFKELAEAKAKQDQAARAKAAEEQAKRDAEVKRLHDAEVARLEAERKKKEADDAVKHKAQEDHDKAEVARLLGLAKEQLAKQQFDAARGTIQTARHIQPSPEIDNLLHLIQDQQDLADAKKKSEQARLNLEKKQAEERRQRELADAEAKKKQDAYTAALRQAQDALAVKQYDKAIASYQEAGKLFKTDVVINGQRQAEELRDREKAQADADRRKQDEETKRNAQVQKLLADGQKSLDAKQFDQAISQFQEARKLAPGNVDVLTALSKAEHARDQLAAANRDKAEEDKKAAFNKVLHDADAAFAAKRYDDAIRQYTDALKFMPGDPTAVKGLKDATQARDTAKADETTKKKQADYQQAVQSGRSLLQAKKYDEAIRAFTDALRIMPNDKDAKALLMDAEKQQADARAAQDAEAKRKQEEERKKQEFARLLNQAQAAMSAKKFNEAATDYREALRLMPGDPTATKGLKDANTALDAARADADSKKRQADYQREMQTGRTALQAMKYDDAIKAFTEALKIMPNDKDATALLKDAEKQKADAAKPPPPSNPELYKKQMDSGAALEKQKKFAEALAAYREALKLMPGDAKATAAAKWADFEVHMTEGQHFIDAKKFPDAVKELEEATKLFPDNADAKNLLKKAKEGK
jgi:tetratricopeptide (TPR) repeat protein